MAAAGALRNAETNKNMHHILHLPELLKPKTKILDAGNN
tara:strand:- start:511 stop:627 length:117 start_codon:yes stop_codon:yes gene_type:complete